MKESTGSWEILLPGTPEEVFPFFSDPANLGRITPPWIGFEILTPRPVEMAPGTLLDYRIRLHGLPMRWRSEITVWEPPHRFVDVQLRGPYRLWVHEHTFEAAECGTLAQDHLRYALPGGALLGGLADRLFVRRDVEKIFAWRQQKLREILGPAGGS